jgi:hypothetical protein
MSAGADYLKKSLELIILQYADKPNALAEITNLIQPYADIWDFFASFIPAFDIDNATGDRLDLIGKIVDLPRGIFDDDDYRFFLKAKIASNNVRARMAGNNSLQQAYQYVFGADDVMLIDNKDMSVSLVVYSSFVIDIIKQMKGLDLLPLPQGVGITYLLYSDSGINFGFAGQNNAGGFGQAPFMSLVSL